VRAEGYACPSPKSLLLLVFAPLASLLSWFCVRPFLPLTFELTLRFCVRPFLPGQSTAEVLQPLPQGLPRSG